MKRSWIKGKSSDPKKLALRRADDAVSKLVRQHYSEDGIHLGCATCPKWGEWNYDFDNGHFQWRERMNTRYHYKNLLPQCQSCNRFKGGKTYELGKKLDSIWGDGTADEMVDLSAINRTWTEDQLDLIASAARKGWLVYLQIYDELSTMQGLQKGGK